MEHFLVSLPLLRIPNSVSSSVCVEFLPLIRVMAGCQATHSAKDPQTRGGHAHPGFHRSPARPAKTPRRNGCFSALSYVFCVDTPFLDLLNTGGRALRRMCNDPTSGKTASGRAWVLRRRKQAAKLLVSTQREQQLHGTCLVAVSIDSIANELHPEFD